MTLFMETTGITPERSVAEIQTVLARHGAKQILVEYAAGQVEAISFQAEIEPGRMVPFRLPCRHAAVFELLYQRRKRGAHTERILDGLKDKARRVAWRQILRWVEAQFALVETSMVKVHEVFLPYMQVRGGQTVFEELERNKFQLEHKP